MSTLIVTLPLLPFSASTPCESVLVDDGATVARQVEAPVALLPSAPGAEVVAVVPVQSLSWHRLTLPRGTLDHGYFSEGSAPRLRSVLEGLLEDRLLDEPSHLHFALEPQAQDSTPVWVAACDRAWLQAWIAALEQAGRPVARIVPEMAPHSSGAPAGADLQVMGTPEQAQLVHNGPDGLTRKANSKLYSMRGLHQAREALNPGGVLAVWSAARDPAFTRRLGDAGFAVEEIPVRARSNGKGAHHIIWLATAP